MLHRWLKIQKMDLLISIYIFCLVTAELMGGKTFPIVTIAGFTFSTSVSVFFILLIYSINDIITEVFGAERTRSIIRSGLLMVLLLIVFSLIFIALPPTTRFAPNEKAYDTIFGISARFSLASFVAFVSAEFLDVYIFSMVRKKLGKKSLWLRTNASNFGSQFIDTIVFMTLAFYALDQSFASNFAFIMGLTIPYWIVKCCISVIETPIVYWGVNWLRSDKAAIKT